MNDIAISIRDLSKSYRMYPSPKERMKELLHPFGKKYHQDFWALRDVSFEVKKGECIGIIGRNGCGKSTLLQILCGVLPPTSGEVKVIGRISALLELGAGFNPEFTGRDNVYMNGAMMGLTYAEMTERFDEIAAFADIGDFIEQPVKTYSSGMYVRLAFAAAINVDPDILVVDEALAVGDMFFQAKCMARMKKMIDRGVTLLFVSHDTGAVKSVCQKALLFDNGNMVLYDKSDKVVEKYFGLKVKSEQSVIADSADRDGKSVPDPTAPQICTIDEALADNKSFLKKASFQRIQNGKAAFVNVQLLDETCQVIETVKYEQDVILRMAVEASEDIPVLAYGYHIRDRNGIDVVYSSAGIENKLLYNVKAGEHILIDWKFKVSLLQGMYHIACVLSIPQDMEIDKVDFCDFVPIAVQFSMQQRKTERLYGLTHWRNDLLIKRINPEQQRK